MIALIAAVRELRELVVSRISEQEYHGAEEVTVFVCDLCSDLSYDHGDDTVAAVYKLWETKKPQQTCGLGWWPQDEAGHAARLSAIDSIINELKEQEHGSESSGS